MKKILSFPILLLLVSALLCSCASNTSITFPIDIPGVEPEPSLIDEFEMEKVGESAEGNFSYWRDMATDVLYIRFRDSSGYAGQVDSALCWTLKPASPSPIPATWNCIAET